jgi:hypothetical protein
MRQVFYSFSLFFFCFFSSIDCSNYNYVSFKKEDIPSIGSTVAQNIASSVTVAPLSFSKKTLCPSKTISYQFLSSCNFDKKETRRLRNKSIETFRDDLWNRFCGDRYHGITPHERFEDYVFHQLNLYQFENFLNYAKSLPGFDSFILGIDHFLWHHPKAESNRAIFKDCCGFKRRGFEHFIGGLKREIEAKQRQAEARERKRQQKEEIERRKEKMEWVCREALSRLEKHCGQNSEQELQEERIQNYREMLQVYDQEEEVVIYAKRCVEEFTLNGERIYAERIEAVIAFLQQPDFFEERVYSLDDQTKSTLDGYCMHPEQYKRTSGNYIQHNIHQELVDILSNTSHMRHHFGGEEFVGNYADIIFRSSDIAFDLKNEKSYERSYAMIDMARSVGYLAKDSAFAFGKGMGKFSSDTKELLDKVTAISTKEEFVNAGLTIVKSLYLLMRTSPISMDYMLHRQSLQQQEHEVANPEYLKDLFLPKQELDSPIDYFVLNLHYGERTSPKPDYETWRKEFAGNIDSIDREREEESKVFWEKLKSNKQQAFLDGVTETTRFMFSCALFGAASEKVIAFTNAALEAVANEARVLAHDVKYAQDAANNIFEARWEKAPILNSLESSKEVFEVATSEGVKVTENALTSIKNNPSALMTEGSVTNAIKETSRLMSSALSVYKGKITCVGRAFQKHATRSKTCFTGELTGDALKNTEQGITYIKKILSDSNVSCYTRNTKSFGKVFEARLPSGMGARWTDDKAEFIGFLESFSKKGNV